jgi:hypothetical protein
MKLILIAAISITLTSFILIGFFRINFLKKKNEAILTGLMSMISIGFGYVLLLVFSLPYDYGTELYPVEALSQGILYLANLNVCCGLGFVLISVMKFLGWQIKNGILKI